MYFFGGRQIDAQDTEITNLESQLGLTKADCRDLQNQMSLINSLFTQMLLGATSADMDLDRLTQLLQVWQLFINYWFKFEILLSTMIHKDVW